MPPPAFVAARCSALAGRGSTSTQAGVHPKVVQERLRHGTIAITLDTYSHAIPAMKEKRRQKIAALIQGPG